MKPLEAALARIVRYQERDTKISLKQYLDQHQGIEEHLKLFCGSTKCKSVNFHSTLKRGQHYPTNRVL